MATKEFRLPDPGEGLTEAEIVTWKVKVGDTVKVNDIVVEVETAKSLVELPVPFAGTVAALLVSEGDMVEVGTPIISVETGSAPGAEAAPPAGESTPQQAASQQGDDTAGDKDVAEEIEEGKIGGTTSTGRTAVLVGYGVKNTEAKRRPRKATADVPEPEGEIGGRHEVRLNPTRVAQSKRPAGSPIPSVAPAAAMTAEAPRGDRPLAKPPVRKLAKDLGIDLGEVTGTGEGGVVTRADVEQYAAAGPAHTAPGTDAAVRSAAPGERETREPIKGVRKMMAQAMVGSAFGAPHVTEWITVDVTKTMELVESLKKDRAFREVKVTPMLVLAKAMCLAVRRHPMINSTWDEDAQEIVVKHYVNLGIAAATPRGLVVPNIKDADAMGLVELAESIGALTATAREGRTQPAEMADGTITITNVGVFGVDLGTPIINPGESAIMAFGAVRRMPWVVETDTGSGVTEEIVPRWVSQLALSFDHRHIDGELGSRFLADVASILEDPARALLFA
ncbi:2-oxo acid dehydrogenase subunit E2 [Nostocoides sp. F2B08]|uniref:dihydrolipoamide acetyltransferase family protein n=1 Tax=Nostocoides sp. F2B08 TaxID=2653936 RepID=UPI0012632FDD|nr:dihydrolipoamide acetyltransferase family protein [Tetrasphaera sp. F2B08]KAB7743972.1 2-oxo acid dehydrogenase subunit E2 [Tetrasphaera sp. F2B08]